MVERCGRSVAHFFHQGANASQAGIIVGLAEIDRTANLRVHLRATQFLRGGPLADGGLHERRAGEKKAAAIGHQNVVAHHRKVSAPRYAHAHDGGNLRDAHRTHNGVVAEDAAEIVGIGKNVFLQRKKNAGGIDQINGGNVIFDGDILGADHLLGRHREECAGFYRGIVRDDHHAPAGDSSQPGDGSGGGRSAPLLIHFVCGVDSKLEEFRAGIDEFGDALARRQTAFFVLRFDGLRPASLADFLLFLS